MAEDYLTGLMKQLKDKTVSETGEENADSETQPQTFSTEKSAQTTDEEIILSAKKEDAPIIKAPTYEAEIEGPEAEGAGREGIGIDRTGAETGALSPLKKEIIEGDEKAAEVIEKTTAEKEVEQSQKIELKSYGKVKIFKIPEKPLPYYFIPTPRPTSAERKIINTIKEATTRLISIAPYKVRDPEQRRIVYKQKIIEIIKNSPSLRVPESRINFYAEAVVREMVGYGIIDDLIKDDGLEEIMIIGPKKPIYVFHREFEMMSTNIEFFSEQEIEDLINKIAREVGRRVDVSAPLLDARLPDGSRVNATIPPASISGGTLTIRKFRADPYSIIDLVKLGTLTSEAAAFLWLCAEGMSVKPANILISGGTGSGKTTLLNVLTAFVPERERVITIEDTAELSLPLKHWIRMEGRPPGLEGTGELKMDILTKNSLRMRPDRIIVGEIRHEEAFTLFTALNTGHDGCMGTVHANSPQETIIRVTNPPMNVPQIMLSGLDLIIIEHRMHDRKKGTIRRITEIAEIYNALEGNPKTETIYKWDPIKDTLEKTLVNSRYLADLRAFSGLNKEQINAELEIRKTFLEELLKQNVRSISAVSSATKKFLTKKAEAGDTR
ncbi:MAG: CpaF family protein [Candidatus Diapherotrites archaeon]|nr:CpaF family protein [Candidatus Diapherotrites archaeon]